MAWIVRRLRDALRPLLERLWRTLLHIWRSSIRTSGALLGRTRLALGSGTENETREKGAAETRPPEPEEVRVEGAPGEGQPEAGASDEAARQRPDAEEEDEPVRYFDCEEQRKEPADEFYCDYDSTWDTDDDPEAPEGQEGPIRRTSIQLPSRHYMFNRFRNAARDMQNYRHGYPCQNRPRYRNRTESADDKPNLEFYLGTRPSSPDGVYISSFHNDWYGQYDTLEYVHTYIQWLFPLQEPGMNFDASPLTKAEIEEFHNNAIAKENLLTSYKLMLDFYGIELCDEDTGDVSRALNWRDRFNNLNSHSHNNLRITRILKCLGTLGYPHYQAPLVRFFLQETLVHGELPQVKDSVLCYFVFAVLDKRQRRNLIKFAYMNYDDKDEFVWCPKKLQVKWSASKSKREMSRSNKAAVFNTPPVVIDLDLEGKDEYEES